VDISGVSRDEALLYLLQTATGSLKGAAVGRRTKLLVSAFTYGLN